ncbi:hypothetical protein AB0C10_26580 [Microbispora amethystogenes]
MVDSVGEAVDALGEGVDSVAESVNPFGEVVDSVGEAIDALGEVVDPFGEAVDPVVEAVDAVGEVVDPDVESLDVAVQAADLAVDAVEPDRHDAHLPLEDADVRSRLRGDLLHPEQAVAHLIDFVPSHLRRVVRVLCRLLAAINAEFHEVVLQALDALFEGEHGHRASSNCRAAQRGLAARAGCAEDIAISFEPSLEGEDSGNSRDVPRGIRVVLTGV